MTPVSVVILAKNEADFIGRCIQSVLSWADEVLVLDSGSTDDTREIAASLGAAVHEQEWLGWAGQRNLALSLAKNDWVFSLESDEIVSEKLSQSIVHVLQGDMAEKDGYYVVRRGDFLGVLLYNESNPVQTRALVRLFNRAHAAWDTEMGIHELVKVEGHVLPLRGVLVHWRGYTMDEYFTAFHRYARAEADVLYRKGKRVSGPMVLLRPTLRFFWCMFYVRDFKWGTRGLIHALLKAMEEYMRYALLWEMQNAPRQIHPSAAHYSPSSTADQTA